MLHAVQYRIAQWPEDESFTMVTGPAMDGTLLEVGVLGLDQGEDPVIIHAMLARAAYLPHRKDAK